MAENTADRDRRHRRGHPLRRERPGDRLPLRGDRAGLAGPRAARPSSPRRAPPAAARRPSPGSGSSPGSGHGPSTAARSTTTSRTRCTSRSSTSRSSAPPSPARTTSSPGSTAAASPARPARCGSVSPAASTPSTPRPTARPEEGRHADPRRADQGAQEGRSEEGPQGSAVQQALTRRAPWVVCSEPTGSAAWPTWTSPPSWRSTSRSRLRTCSAETGAFAGHRPSPLSAAIRAPRGEFLEAAVVAGLASAGVDVLRLGVLPTPASPT